MNISQDEKERAVFRSRMMYQTDLQSDLATAEDRGKRIRNMEIVQNALQMNMSIADIAKLTGLSFEEITALSK